MDMTEIELLEGEEIKDVVGYEGLYAVTSFGRVWGYKNKHWIKAIKKKKEYLEVCLSKESKKTYIKIHKLVALAFIENPNNYPTIDHIDRNPSNNNKNNLRWSTCTEQNLNRDCKTEKFKKTHQESIKKAIEKAKELKTWEKANEIRKRKVICIETKIIYESLKEAIQKTGIKNIADCCRKRNKTAGGYHWEYANE